MEGWQKPGGIPCLEFVVEDGNPCEGMEIHASGWKSMSGDGNPCQGMEHSGPDRGVFRFFFLRFISKIL